MVRRMARRTHPTVPRVRAGEADAATARLRRLAVVLASADAGAVGGEPSGRAFRARAGGRVPGHEHASGRDPAGNEAEWRRIVRGRRRRPGDLLVSRRRGREHPRISNALHAAGADHHARSQLPFAAADPRCGQRVDERERSSVSKTAALRAAFSAEALVRHRRRRPQPVPVCRRASAGKARTGHAAEAAGDPDAQCAPQRRAGGRTGPTQHSLREIRRPEVPRGRARQRRARAAALDRQSAQSPRWLSHACSCCRASARRSRIDA